MSSPIRSLRQSRPAPSQRASQAASPKKGSGVSAQPAASSRTSQLSAAAPNAAKTSAASTSALTESEQQMIARQFPNAPKLSMRLYGPDRDAQTVRPSAVGSRLDVQG